MTTLVRDRTQLTLPAWLSKYDSSQQTLIMGVGLAVLSNVLFGVLYTYSSWLAPLSGTQVFLWRIIAMWVAIVSFMSFSGGIKKSLHTLQSLKTAKQWAWLLIPTPIFASQFWLFMWAPINGQGVQTAMGYFLFPLMMVIFGCVFFGEKLSKLQWVAVALAALGVTSELFRTQSLSWATLWVCTTYPIYYIMRRKQGISALTGLLVDLTILLPFAVGYLVLYAPTAVTTVAGSATLMLLLVGLGVISVLAMQTNVSASQKLPVNVFGMLSYLEPALLFMLAITVLGNPFEQGMLLSYGLIWSGIACLIWHGISSFRNNHKKLQNKSDANTTATLAKAA
ncbi:EamA family transporter RarD [Psychrobacter sp. I-STPA10]|uniref:EamA family transporter RarD n=1 Tax=Psychrobacter sp. I-STPA10 TaxID=2585769 RepID=UPI001E5142EB|nr:EamA family transporter RarD [Psychrobacter sp. I-STPA10]